MHLRPPAVRRALCAARPRAPLSRQGAAPLSRPGAAPLGLHPARSAWPRAPCRCPSVAPLSTQAACRAPLGEASASESSAPAGLGFVTEPLGDVSPKQLFKAMMFNIDGADRFHPVTSVTVRAAHGDAADAGAVWRSMKYVGPGPLNGQTIVEHVYTDSSEGLIRFVRLEGPRQREGPLEVVHMLHRDPLRIECFQRNRLTLERVHWPVPLKSVAEAIKATVALARAAEDHAAAYEDFGGKA